jgi:uncharacterized protein (UPF0147 family)
MDKFELDIKKFCLCHLDYYVKDEFLNDKYVPIRSRTFVWKVLMCNKILKFVNTDDCNKYIEELEKSSPVNMSIESRHEIWNVIQPIYKKLKAYSSLNFKPTDLYISMSNNGYVKEEISNMLNKSGAHSWTSYISPITEKFWIACDFPFSEFIERIKEYGIPEIWWDFHQTSFIYTEAFE